MEMSQAYTCLARCQEVTEFGRVAAILGALAAIGFDGYPMDSSGVRRGVGIADEVIHKHLDD